MGPQPESLRAGSTVVPLIACGTTAPSGTTASVPLYYRLARKDTSSFYGTTASVPLYYWLAPKDASSFHGSRGGSTASSSTTAGVGRYYRPGNSRILFPAQLHCLLVLLLAPSCHVFLSNVPNDTHAQGFRQYKALVRIISIFN